MEERLQKMKEQEEEVSRRLLTKEEELVIDLTMEENGMNDIPTPPSACSLGDPPEPGMIRLCPLCKSRISLFYINFTEKLLMCENDQCEWPFGHEELTFVKTENDGVKSIRSEISSQVSCGTSGSISSGSIIRNNIEIDQINAALYSEYSDTESICTTSTFDSYLEMQPRKLQENDNIEENIKKIKTITMELQDETEKVPKTIKDPKRLRKLRNLEYMSGKSLLKPVELKRLASQKPMPGLREFKIEYTPGTEGTLTSICIDILVDPKDEPKDEPKSPGEFAP